MTTNVRETVKDVLRRAARRIPNANLKSWDAAVVAVFQGRAPVESLSEWSFSTEVLEEIRERLAALPLSEVLRDAASETAKSARETLIRDRAREIERRAPRRTSLLDSDDDYLDDEDDQEPHWVLPPDRDPTQHDVTALENLLLDYWRASRKWPRLGNIILDYLRCVAQERVARRNLLVGTDRFQTLALFERAESGGDVEASLADLVADTLTLDFPHSSVTAERAREYWERYVATVDDLVSDDPGSSPAISLLSWRDVKARLQGRADRLQAQEYPKAGVQAARDKLVSRVQDLATVESDVADAVMSRLEELACDHRIVGDPQWHLELLQDLEYQMDRCLDAEESKALSVQGAEILKLLEASVVEHWPADALERDRRLRMLAEDIDEAVSAVSKELPRGASRTVDLGRVVQRKLRLVGLDLNHGDALGSRIVNLITSGQR